MRYGIRSLDLLSPGSELLLSTNIFYTHLRPFGYLHFSPPVQMAWCLLMKLVQLIRHGRNLPLQLCKGHCIAERTVHMAPGSCSNTQCFLHWNQRWRGNHRASVAEWGLGGGGYRVWREDKATWFADDTMWDSWLECLMGHTVNCELANATQTLPLERGRSPGPGACGTSSGARAVTAQRGCLKAETNICHHG